MHIDLNIEGMHCEGCVRAVRNVLGAVDGVTSVSVDLEQGRAHVGSEKPLSPQALTAAVEEAGYHASLA